MVPFNTFAKCEGKDLRSDWIFRLTLKDLILSLCLKVKKTDPQSGSIIEIIISLKYSHRFEGARLSRYYRPTSFIHLLQVTVQFKGRPVNKVFLIRQSQSWWVLTLHLPANIDSFNSITSHHTNQTKLSLHCHMHRNQERRTSFLTSKERSRFWRYFRDNQNLWSKMKQGITQWKKRIAFERIV